MLTSTVNISPPPSSKKPTEGAALAITTVRTKAKRRTVHVDSRHHPPQMVNIAFFRLRVTPLRCSLRFKFWRRNLICLKMLRCLRLFSDAGGDSPPTSSSIDSSGAGCPSSPAVVDDTTAADTCLGRKNMVRRFSLKNNRGERCVMRSGPITRDCYCRSCWLVFAYKASSSTSDSSKVPESFYVSRLIERACALRRGVVVERRVWGIFFSSIFSAGMHSSTDVDGNARTVPRRRSGNISENDQRLILILSDSSAVWHLAEI